MKIKNLKNNSFILDCSTTWKLFSYLHSKPQVWTCTFLGWLLVMFLYRFFTCGYQILTENYILIIHLCIIMRYCVAFATTFLANAYRGRKKLIQIEESISFITLRIRGSFTNIVNNMRLVFPEQKKNWFCTRTIGQCFSYWIFAHFCEWRHWLKNSELGKVAQNTLEWKYFKVLLAVWKTSRLSKF